MENRKSNILYIIFIIIVLIVIALCAVIAISKNNNIETDIYNLEDNEVNNIEDVQSEIVTNKELFEDYYDSAEILLRDMTLEEKVGQMFLVRYPSNEVINEIINDAPGGYILFARDFENKTKDEITEELQKCQESSKIKLFLGVDEEGGRVVRVSKFKEFRDEPFKSPSAIYEEGGIDSIINDSTEKSALLTSLGINMNLAPVSDVTTNESSFIYSRALGKDAFVTAEYVKAVINTMNNDKMISVMKHFPRIW